jgi:eukaryotic-like serine/threonine-protein kinase
VTEGERLPRVPGYELTELIGRGGMAEVYRAVAQVGPLAGRTVAVKRLIPALACDAGYVALFQQEATLTRRLRHPAVVAVLDAAVADGVPFIAMEYVDGRNLKEVLARCARRGILLPVDFAAYVAHVIAQALAHAHGGRDALDQPLGIVHNDVSPSNVFISRLGEIKLGDFGVARLLGVAPGVAPAGPGAFGKIHYLAPELLRGERPTPRSDLFALGSVFHELLTNRCAFPGGDVAEVGERVLAAERPAPSALRPEVPVALDALVLSCLQLEPERRIGSAAAFAADVAESYDPAVGTPLAIAAVVRGLFG